MAETEKSAAKSNQPLALFAAVAGWLVPGLGHLLLGKWGKAIGYFLAVASLAVVGLRLRGDVFTSAGDAFGTLGFLADLGSGVFYFLARTINAAGPDVSRAAGDYGTRLIATAGVLNLLCVLEAFQIGLHRDGKS
jgi:TM2 domain-containing membrane protein YozV